MTFRLQRSHHIANSTAVSLRLSPSVVPRTPLHPPFTAGPTSSASGRLPFSLSLSSRRTARLVCCNALRNEWFFPFASECICIVQR